MGGPRCSASFGAGLVQLVQELAVAGLHRASGPQTDSGARIEQARAAALARAAASPEDRFSTARPGPPPPSTPRRAAPARAPAGARSVDRHTDHPRRSHDRPPSVGDHRTPIAVARRLPADQSTRYPWGEHRARCVGLHEVCETFANVGAASPHKARHDGASEHEAPHGTRRADATRLP